jgi:hypothetical protein
MSLSEPSSVAVGRLPPHLRAWLSPRTNHMIVALASGAMQVPVPGVQTW